MNKTVWNREIDTALKTLIEENVRCYNPKGERITPLAYPSYPDEDLRDEQFPCVTFFNYNQTQRMDRSTFTEQRSVKDGVATIKSPIKQFSMYYQIDFWALFQDDINEMTRTFLQSLGDVSHVLPVITQGGERDYINMTLLNQRPSKEGREVGSTKQESSRYIYRKTYSFDIWGRIDSEKLRKIPVVRKMTFHNTGTGRDIINDKTNEST